MDRLGSQLQRIRSPDARRTQANEARSDHLQCRRVRQPPGAPGQMVDKPLHRRSSLATEAESAGAARRSARIATANRFGVNLVTTRMSDALTRAVDRKHPGSSYR